jgi:O-antigen biosynthesis protein WbqV
MTANPPAEVARALPHVFDPEFDDRYERLLLGRDPVEIEQPELAGVVGGRTVLVTGAGGSIGSRCRCCWPGWRRRGWFCWTRASTTCSRSTRSCGNMRRTRSERWRCATCATIARWTAGSRAPGPTWSFTPAALKHVPLLEDQVEEAVLTNVLGTLNVARMARRHEVGVAVLLSTDKAVNPVSVMGATKRCAELLFQAFAGEGGHDGPRFISVRFGNVLGSTGSVVPLFERRSPKADP